MFQYHVFQGPSLQALTFRAVCPRHALDHKDDAKPKQALLQGGFALTEQLLPVTRWMCLPSKPLELHPMVRKSSQQGLPPGQTTHPTQTHSTCLGNALPTPTMQYFPLQQRVPLTVTVLKKQIIGASIQTAPANEACAVNRTLVQLSSTILQHLKCSSQKWPMRKKHPAV